MYNISQCTIYHDVGYITMCSTSRCKGYHDVQYHDMQFYLMCSRMCCISKTVTRHYVLLGAFHVIIDTHISVNIIMLIGIPLLRNPSHRNRCWRWKWDQNNSVLYLDIKFTNMCTETLNIKSTGTGNIKNRMPECVSKRYSDIRPIEIRQ